jgi:hypothetical protein
MDIEDHDPEFASADAEVPTNQQKLENQLQAEGGMTSDDCVHYVQGMYHKRLVVDRISQLVDAFRSLRR